MLSQPIINKKLNEISLDLNTIAGFMLPDYGRTVKDYEKYMKWDGFHYQTNQIYNVLEQLESLMTKKGEHFRARAYAKAKEAIILYKNPIIV